MRLFNIFTLIITLVLISGCNKNKEHDNNNEHEHKHDEKLHLTVYTSDYEIYTIATPFVAGQTSEVLVHVTLLEGFKPFSEGNVTATLNTDNQLIRQTVERCSHSGNSDTHYKESKEKHSNTLNNCSEHNVHNYSPGVFAFQLKPETVGDGDLTFEIETAEGVLITPKQPIIVYSNSACVAAGESIIETVNEAVFSKEQSWIIDFSTEDVREELIGNVIKAVGQIKSSPTDERIISSTMSGIVKMLEKTVVGGVKIKSGESLFMIDGSAMAENNLSVRYTEIESEFNRAEAEYERKVKLAAEHIISESDLLQAEAAYRSAEANYNNLKNNFSLGEQSVFSPVSGYVNRLMVQNGQFVEAGEPVLSISQNRDLIIQANIQSKYFNQLDDIKSVNIKMMNEDKSYSLEELNGRIISYGRNVDLSNPLITLTLQIENNRNLLPGSYVELFVKIEGYNKAITVPNESLVEEMGNYFVYVQVTPELFEKRLINKGASDGIRTEVLSGLSRNERVVAQGAVLVKLSQSTGSVDAHSGHVH